MKWALQFIIIFLSLLNFSILSAMERGVGQMDKSKEIRFARFKRAVPRFYQKVNSNLLEQQEIEDKRAMVSHAFSGWIVYVGSVKQCWRKLMVDFKCNDYTACSKIKMMGTYIQYIDQLKGCHHELRDYLHYLRDHKKRCICMLFARLNEFLGEVKNQIALCFNEEKLEREHCNLKKRGYT